MPIVTNGNSAHVRNGRYRQLCTSGGRSLFGRHVTEHAAGSTGTEAPGAPEGVSILLSHTGEPSTELSRTASPPVSGRQGNRLTCGCPRRFISDDELRGAAVFGPVWTAGVRIVDVCRCSFPLFISSHSAAALSFSFFSQQQVGRRSRGVVKSSATVTYCAFMAFNCNVTN